MSRPSHVLLLCAAALIIASATQATVPSSTWAGTATSENAGDPTNWSGNTLPADGAELTFGDVTGAPSNQTITIPENLSVDDLIFGGSNRPAYSFLGSDGAVVSLTGGLYAGTGANITFDGTLGLKLDTSWQQTANIANGVEVAIGSDISGFGGITMETGTGTLTLNGNNSFSGGFSLHAGRVNLGSDTAWGTGSVKLYEGTIVGLINSASHYEVSNSIELDCAEATNVTFNIQPSDSALTLTSDITGEAGLIKTGSGTLALSGYNTYGGATVVNAGTLRINSEASINGSGVTVNNGGTLLVQNSADVYSTVTVNNGGKLTGKGYVSEAIIGAGATLSPGFGTGLNDRIGELTFLDLTLGKDSVLEIDVRHLGNGTFSFDELTVTSPSTLTITADATDPITLKLTSLNSDGLPGNLANGLQIGTTYSLSFLSYHSGIVGDLTLGQNLILDTSAFTADLPGADFSLTHSGNTFTLTFTPVPEPSTYALLALGLGLIGLSLWRKRHV